MRMVAPVREPRALSRREARAVRPRHVELYGPRRLRLWLPLPLSLLWVLLAPFAIFLSLFAGLAPRRYRIDGPTAAWRIGEVLFALSGTVIEIKSRSTDIFIRIF
jgi:hypothetical protein